MRGMKMATMGIVSLVGMIGGLTVMNPLRADPVQKPEVLFHIPIDKGWKDDTSASARPTWKRLPQEQDQEAGVDQGKLTLRAVEPTISGTEDWGGGGARQEGKVEVRFEVQSPGGSASHEYAAERQPVRPKEPPVKDPHPKDVEKEQPAQKPALKATATVDGYTQATAFNQQKYPFKYTGTSTLDAEQVKALGKAGEIPADVTKALLGCLLWPKEGDSLQKAALKSDGKKLTGEAEVLHRYGKQGTHTIQLRLEGSVEDGKVSLKVVAPSVAGTWDYGGGSIKLKGDAAIRIVVEQL